MNTERPAVPQIRGRGKYSCEGSENDQIGRIKPGEGRYAYFPW